MLSLIAAAAVIAGGAALIVTMPFFKNMVVRYAVSAVARHTQATLSIGRVGGSLISGVVLEQVSIAGPQGLVFSADKLAASYSLPALIRGRVYLSAVRLSNPVLYLARNEAGQWNIEKLLGPPSPKKGSSPLFIRIKDIAVRNGRVSISAPAAQPKVFSDITISAAIENAATSRGSRMEIQLHRFRATSRAPAFEIANMFGTIRVQGERVSIENFFVQTSSSQARGHGAIAGGAHPRFQLHMQFPVLSIAELESVAGVGSLVHAAHGFDRCSSGIDAEGSTDSFAITQSIALPGIRIDNRIRAEVPNRRYTLESRFFAQRPAYVSSGTLHASWNDNRITVQGSIPLSSSTLTIDLAGMLGNGAISVERLNLRSGIGEVRARGSFAYVGKMPALALQAEGHDIAYQGIGVSSFTVRAQLRGAMRMPRGTLDLRAAGVRAKGRSLDDVAIRLDGESMPMRLSAQAHKNPLYGVRLDGYLTIAGSTASVSLDTLAVSIGTATWFNQDAVRASISPVRFAIDSLRMAYREESMRLSGGAGFAGPLALALDITSVDVGALGHAVKKHLPLTGKLTLHMTLQGSRQAPLIDGFADLAGGSMGELAFDHAPVSFRYAAKQLNVSAAIETKASVLFIASGTIPVDLALAPVPDRWGRDGLAASVRSNALDLSVLGLFTDAVEGSGKATLHLTVAGNLSQPVVDGDIDIVDGRLSVLATGTTYDEFNASLRIRNSRLSVNHCSLRSGTGTAQIRGTVSLDQGLAGQTDLRITCADFKIMNTRLFSGVITTDLHLTGTGENPALAGTVQTGQTSVHIESSVEGDIPDVVFVNALSSSTAAVPEPSPLTEWYNRLGMAVALRIPGRAWLYGYGLSTEIEGRVLLHKQRLEPLIFEGELTTVRGFFTVNERNLTITRASMKLDGSNIMEAVINADASTTINKTVIDAHYAGTLANPVLTFTSDPPMERTEILSYLVFGVPSKELSQSQGAALQGGSFGVLENFAKKQVKGVLDAVLPVDVLTIQPTQSRIGAGKYLTRNLFVQYEWRTAQDEGPQTVLDYRLNEYFDIMSQLGNQKKAGADIFWRISY